VHAAIRREGLPAVSASNFTAGDLVAAMQVAREVEEARRGADPAPAPLGMTAHQPELLEGTPSSSPTDENVKSLSSARHGK
jgi:hypothetical protein